MNSLPYARNVLLRVCSIFSYKSNPRVSRGQLAQGKSIGFVNCLQWGTELESSFFQQKDSERVFYGQIYFAFKRDPDSLKRVTGIMNLKVPSIGDEL